MLSSMQEFAARTMGPCLRGQASAVRCVSCGLQDSLLEGLSTILHALLQETLGLRDFDFSNSLLMQPACMVQDREQIPQWMPWIQSVRVLPEDKRLSRWTLATEQFGRTWELSWVSLNLAPIKNQKVTSSGLGFTRVQSAEGGAARLCIPSSPALCFLSHVLVLFPLPCFDAQHRNLTIKASC